MPVVQCLCVRRTAHPEHTHVVVFEDGGVQRLVVYLHERHITVRTGGAGGGLCRCHRTRDAVLDGSAGFTAFDRPRNTSEKCRSEASVGYQSVANEERWFSPWHSIEYEVNKTNKTIQECFPLVGCFSWFHVKSYDTSARKSRTLVFFPEHTDRCFHAYTAVTVELRNGSRLII